MLLGTRPFAVQMMHARTIQGFSISLVCVNISFAKNVCWARVLQLVHFPFSLCVKTRLNQDHTAGQSL